MLVLSRKTGESVVVGDDITITVLEIKGERIKLGIDAPAAITIIRPESSYDAHKNSNR